MVSGFARDRWCRCIEMMRCYGLDCGYSDPDVEIQDVPVEIRPHEQLSPHESLNPGFDEMSMSCPTLDCVVPLEGASDSGGVTTCLGVLALVLALVAVADVSKGWLFVRRDWVSSSRKSQHHRQPSSQSRFHWASPAHPWHRGAGKRNSHWLGRPPWTPHLGT